MASLSNMWQVVKEKTPAPVKNAFSFVKCGLAPIIDKVKSVGMNIIDKVKSFMGKGKTEDKSEQVVSQISSVDDVLKKMDDFEKITYAYKAEKAEYRNMFDEINADTTLTDDEKNARVQSLDALFLQKTDGTSFESIDEKYGGISEDNVDAFMSEVNSMREDIINGNTDINNEDIASMVKFVSYIEMNMKQNEVSGEAYGVACDVFNEVHAQTTDTKLDVEKIASDYAHGTTNSEFMQDMLNGTQYSVQV